MKLKVISICYLLVALILSGPAYADTTGPVMSNINENESDTSVIITWQTDEEATSRLVYGGGASGEVPLSSAYTTNHSVEITGLTASTYYYYQIYVYDRAGNLTKLKPWRAFTTLAEPPQDTTGPVMSNINESESDTSVIITWQTDEEATSRLVYGGGASGEVPLSSAYTTSHSVEITGLTASTYYYYQIYVYDRNGNLTKLKPWRDFTTLAEPLQPPEEDTTGPVMSNINENESDTSVVITWQTDEEATSRLVYGGGASGEVPLSSAYTTSHSVEITGLTASTYYYYQIYVYDRNGNLTKLKPWRDFTTLDGSNPPPPPPADTWTPPIGIKAPDFGIEESYMDYVGQTYDHDANPNTAGIAYKDAGNGPYTHYVKPNDAAADNTNNPYGSPAKPRATLPDPNDVKPGAVIEVHGGPFSYRSPGSSRMVIRDYRGTATKPIFIRGPNADNKFVIGNMPGASVGSMGNRVHVKENKYLIMENMKLHGPTLRLAHPNSFISVRHSEFTSQGMSGQTDGIAVWTDLTEFTGNPADNKNNIVIYKNKVHRNGQYPANSETGKFGLMIDGDTKDIWVVDNEMFYNGDDSIQVIDRSIIKAELANAPPANGVYIGRNTIHHDGENAIDIKGSENIIISQNTIWGYEKVHSGTSSWGEAIRINDKEDQNNIWVLFNHIYDSTSGIDPVNSRGKPYVIGNVIHNVLTPIEGGASVVTNNTIYNNCSVGVGYRVSPYWEMTNNIISKCTESHDGSSANDTVHNNFYHQGAGTESCSSCFYTDPQFVDATNTDLAQRDFRIKANSNSEAIDAAGAISPAYTLFSDTYPGLDIRVDADGNPRPADPALWDIGAYEQ